MYKIVYFDSRVKISGVRETIFRNEIECEIIQYIKRNPKLVKEENVENVTCNYKEKIIKSIKNDFENNYYIFSNDHEHGYRFKEIKSIEFTDANFGVKVVDVDSVSYEELRKIANVRELMEIEEYYKKLI